MKEYTEIIPIFFKKLNANFKKYIGMFTYTYIHTEKEEKRQRYKPRY